MANHTHINAYYEDVEKASLKVAEAEAELEAANAALKAHPDYVEPQKEVEVQEEEPVATKSKAPVKKSGKKV